MTSSSDSIPRCPVEVTLSLIDGKWKGIVLYHLSGGTLRFSEIRRRMPAITQRVLTRQLRELESAGLILRRVYPEVPPRVEYRLSPRGQTLRPILEALKAWGLAHQAEEASTREALPGLAEIATIRIDG